jgi:hypothetical protein
MCKVDSSEENVTKYQYLEIPTISRFNSHSVSSQRRCFSFFAHSNLERSLFSLNFCNTYKSLCPQSFSYFFTGLHLYALAR